MYAAGSSVPALRGNRRTAHSTISTRRTYSLRCSPQSHSRKMAMMPDECEDDAAGYKRPPSHTRFRPGRSGNPAGRPKRRPSFRDTLLAELAAAMPGKDPQHARNKLQALVRTLVGALARIGDAEDSEAPSLTPDDREILDAYVGGELKRRAGETDATPSSTEGDADRRPDVDNQLSNKRT
jgi:glycine/D-amino acid oxidase-like deaminating enzyme